MSSIKTHTTTRQFAESINVNPLRMKNLVNTDPTIKAAFCRNRMYYYKPEQIEAWFEKNQHKFIIEPKNVSVKSDEFYCGTNNHYVPMSQKGASGKRCAACDARVAKANSSKKVSGYEGRGKVPQHVLDFAERKNEALLKRELAVINNIDSWMYE